MSRRLRGRDVAALFDDGGLREAASGSNLGLNGVRFDQHDFAAAGAERGERVGRGLRLPREVVR